MSTDGHKQRQVIEYLHGNGDRPVPAIELARMLRITGDRESMRRSVRAIVTQLRDAGLRVCAGHDADGNGGYWLASSHTEWAEYLGAVKSHAKFVFAMVRKRQQAVTDRMGGQKTLFERQGPGNGERGAGKALQWA